MLYFQSITLYHPQLIHAHTLHIYDLFIHLHQQLVGMFKMGLVSIVTGAAHLFQVKSQVPLVSLQWTPIIGTIHLLSLRAAGWVMQINSQFHLWPRGHLWAILMFRDMECTLLSSATVPWVELLAHLLRQHFPYIPMVFPGPMTTHHPFKDIFSSQIVAQWGAQAIHPQGDDPAATGVWLKLHQ